MFLSKKTESIFTLQFIKRKLIETLSYTTVVAFCPHCDEKHSQFLRIKRICSNDADFAFHSKELYNLLFFFFYKKAMTIGYWIRVWPRQTQQDDNSYSLPNPKMSLVSLSFWYLPSVLFTGYWNQLLITLGIFLILILAFLNLSKPGLDLRIKDLKTSVIIWLRLIFLNLRNISCHLYLMVILYVITASTEMPWSRLQCSHMPFWVKNRRFEAELCAQLIFVAYLLT